MHLQTVRGQFFVFVFFNIQWSDSCFWLHVAATCALPFSEWIGKEVHGPIYISQVQIIRSDQFIPACVIFDEALKWSSRDDTHTNPWNFLGRFEVGFFVVVVFFFFCRMSPSQVVLSLLFWVDCFGQMLHLLPCSYRNSWYCIYNTGECAF